MAFFEFPSVGLCSVKLSKVLDADNYAKYEEYYLEWGHHIDS